MDNGSLLTVTTPLPDWPGLATLVAVTTIEAAGAEGAVKRPEPEIEPAEADHVTAVLLVPLTFAVNCCVAEGARVTADGLTVTVIADDTCDTAKLRACVAECEAASVTFTVNEDSPV
jgi:hypothetical protein